MKLSISNIGWSSKNDKIIYELMKKYEYSGLEIAPTRIFEKNPYDRLAEAKKWAIQLKENEDFAISSMQSIWFGRQENLFGTAEERQALLTYTKKAIKFAEQINCRNLVFGCPKNRNMPEDANPETAVMFFKELGDYAAMHNTVIGLEANPPIYNTNFINDTLSAVDLIKKVDSKGFRLNLDIGTMIENGENVSELVDNVGLINHVHISEPGMKLIAERKLHKQIWEVLKEKQYQRFVSIEMGKGSSLKEIEKVMIYVREIFLGAN